MNLMQASFSINEPSATLVRVVAHKRYTGTAGCGKEMQQKHKNSE